MAHRFRFFVAPDDWALPMLTVTGDEAHHAIHVARLAPGGDIEIFDGAGGLANARIGAMTRRDFTAEIVGPVVRMPVPSRQFTLCVANPNRERTLERIVESCVPLGVHRFIVFGGEFSERQPVTSPKWERWAREACKQCQRLWMPEFDTARDLGASIAKLNGAPLMIATPNTPPLHVPGEIRSARRAAGIVGPEGGLSEAEDEIARRRGAIPISLGPNLLRTELACAALMNRVGYEWDTDDLR